MSKYEKYLEIMRHERFEYKFNENLHITDIALSNDRYNINICAYFKPDKSGWVNSVHIFDKEKKKVIQNYNLTEDEWQPFEDLFYELVEEDRYTEAKPA